MKDESPYTKVPNSFFELEGLAPIQKLVLLVIIRKTFGFNKNSDGISLSQFEKELNCKKPTITKAIEILKEKKLIKVQKQYLPNGGKSFNRYTPLVKNFNKGSKDILQGLVKNFNIQKENNTKIEREDIFFNFYEIVENRKTLLKKFIEYLIMVENVKKPVKYSSTIEKKINSRDKETLKNFDKWFIQDYTIKVNEKYKGCIFEDKKIFKIFNHYEMQNNSMFGIALVGSSHEDINKKYFDSIEELEIFLNEVKNGTI